MVLAIATDTACSYFGYDEGLKFLKETGFDGVDFSFYKENVPRILGDDYLQWAKRIKEYLKEYDLVCNQTHAPFAFTYGNPMDNSDPMYLSIVRSMESAAILGAKHIVVHSFRVPEGVDCIGENLKYFQHMERYAKEFGIQIAVENLWSSTKTLKDHNDLVESLNPEHFVGLVDTGHVIMQKAVPEEYIANFAPGRLAGLHIQDNFGHKDNHMIPGIGVINWDGVINALAERNYSGDFTLETNYFESAYGPELAKDMIRLCYKAGRRFANRLEEALKAKEENV